MDYSEQDTAVEIDYQGWEYGRLESDVAPDEEEREALYGDITRPVATSTLQLACPMCGGDIEIEYESGPDRETTLTSLRTYCFHTISREQAYDLLMDESARQAELATERAGERP